MPSLVGRLARSPVGQALKRFPGARAAARALERIPFERRRFLLYRWPTDVPSAATASRAASGLTFRRGTPDDLERMERIETWRPVALYRAWMLGGRTLLLVEDAGEIVSYVFLDPRQDFAVEQVPEIPLRLAEGLCFGDEAYTPVAHRGRGLRRLAFVYELQVAREEGRRGMVTYYSPAAAVDAVQNFARIGFAPGTLVAEVGYWQGGGLRRVSFIDVARDGTVARK